MADLNILNTEVDTDPLGRNYAGMTDQQVADDLNDDTLRSRNRTAMTPTEVYQNIDQTEWAALSAGDQQEIWDILHLGDPLDPFGREASRFSTIFGGGSATITALQAARVESVSRATELGIGFVRAGNVQYVRAN